MLSFTSSEPCCFEVGVKPETPMLGCLHRSEKEYFVSIIHGGLLGGYYHIFSLIRKIKYMVHSSKDISDI